MNTVRRWSARVALMLMLAGVLFALWTIKGKGTRVWPFPRSARLLPGILEVTLWVGASIAALLFLCVLITTLWDEAKK